MIRSTNQKRENEMDSVKIGADHGDHFILILHKEELKELASLLSKQKLSLSGTKICDQIINLMKYENHRNITG